MIRSGVLFFAAVFFLACSSLAMAELVPYLATIDEDGVQRVEIVGGGYFYKPDHIVVKVHVPVELKVSKEGGIIPHDFVIDAPDAGVAVKESLSGEPKVVRFTPTKVGKYPFYCSKKPPFFKSHRDKGMEGVLEVVD